jgi:hypothetical protein
MGNASLTHPTVAELPRVKANSLGRQFTSKTLWLSHTAFCHIPSLSQHSKKEGHSMIDLSHDASEGAAG